MTNEKELREEIRTRLTYATNEDIFDDLERMCNSIVDLLHSHTKEVVEKIGSDLSYALYNLKNSIKHEREGTNIHGHENDLDRDLQALDDLLASLEDNKK